MVKIKICGIRRLEDVRIVNKYKPDYIGFVFADSKRKVSHELASQMKNYFKGISGKHIKDTLFINLISK